jgi:hypothetical protein
MAATSLYRILVPNAPLHRRTEVDEPRSIEFRPRATALREVAPGLEAPTLVSSYKGSIDTILFCFPAWAVSDARYAAGYTSVLAALRVGTRFVVAHNESVRATVEQWLADAGHPPENVQFAPLPDYVRLTDWAEDAYVALTDATDGSRYLIEPWAFPRGGDALIADAVEEYTDISAAGAPLVFQGGNCLIGSDFWLLGRDYFADTLDLLTQGRTPVIVPPGSDSSEFATELFSRHVDADRRLILVGTKRPIPISPVAGSRFGDDYYLDIHGEGAGTFQPIFHIDMFVTLVGEDDAGAFQVLVGSPTLADERLGTSSPYSLAPVYDRIANDLASEGLLVRRNPLVHRSTKVGTRSFAELKELSGRPGNEGLVLAIADLTAAGAVDETRVTVRSWHHVTWNNCLVENSPSVGKHVYLPTYGYGSNDDLAVLDGEMKTLWEELGFTVHLLGDFNPFAERQGVVHCIKKYIVRGDGESTTPS